MADVYSVFITGANRGIGLEFVKQILSKNQIRAEIVVAACRSPENATDLQDLKKSNPSLHIVKLDVCQFDSYDSVVGKVKDIVAEKGLTLLINNAGIIAYAGSLNEVTADQMLSVLKTNTVAPVLLTKAFLPLLKLSAKANSAKTNNGLGISRAAVINITSQVGSVQDNRSGGCWSYRESKAAVNMSSQTLSIELEPDGILVESIHPGWVRTDMGGPNGKIDTVTSVNGMIKVMVGLTHKNKTGFPDFKGTIWPF